MKLNGIRSFLERERQLAERAADEARAKRLAMAASIAGLRAELAILQHGPQDLAQVTRGRLNEMIAELEAYDREVAAPAEARRAKAQLRTSRFEQFVDRVIAA